MNTQNRILRLENRYGRSVVRHGLAFLRSIDLDYRIDSSLGQYSRDILSSMQKLSSRSLGNEAGKKAFERAKRETAVEDIDTIEDFFSIWSSVLRNVQHIAGNTGLVVLSNTIQRGDVASPVVPSIVKCSAHCIPDLRRDVEIVKDSWEPCTFALTETEVRLLSEEGVRNIGLDKIYELDRKLNNLPEHPGSILPIDHFGDAGVALVTVVAGPMQAMELARENITAISNLEVRMLPAREDERILLAMYSGVKDVDVLCFILDLSPKSVRESISRLVDAEFLDNDLSVTMPGAQFAVRVGKL